MHYINNNPDDNAPKGTNDQYTEEPTDDEQPPICPFCYGQECFDSQNDSMFRRRRRRPMMCSHYGMMPMPYMSYSQNMPMMPYSQNMSMPYSQNMPMMPYSQNMSMPYSQNMPYMIHYHYHCHHHYHHR